MFFKKNKTNNRLKWFIYYLVSCFLFTLFILILEITHDFKYNNLILFHIECIFNVFFLLKYFYLKSRFSRILDLIFLISFIILSIYNFIYLQRTFTIYGLTSIWVSIKCMSFYANKLSSPSEENILENQDFWIISGLFLYFSVAFFIFITYDFLTIGYLKGIYDWVGYLWMVHNGILFLSCLFYIKAIRCKE